MTRSGSTLQYNLVRELVAHHHAGEAHGFFEVTPERISDIDAYWFQDMAIHVIKMHSFWMPEPSDMDSQNQIVRSYVFRDIRDVAASLKRKYPISFDETLGIVDEAIRTDELVREYDPICIQRYEELVAEPEKSCQQLAQFLKLTTANETCSAITKSCLQQIEDAFSKFPRQKEKAHRRNYEQVRFIKGLVDRLPVRWKNSLKNFGFQDAYRQLTKTKSQADDVTLVHPDHFSPTRGKAGMWRECFAAHEQRVLQDQYSAWLEQNGYELHQLDE